MSELRIPRSFSVIAATKHFTTFVCQRILKSKQWLKSAANTLLTKDEARRTAVNIAKLPELLLQDR